MDDFKDLEETLRWEATLELTPEQRALKPLEGLNTPKVPPTSTTPNCCPDDGDGVGDGGGFYCRLYSFGLCHLPMRARSPHSPLWPKTRRRPY